MRFKLKTTIIVVAASIATTAFSAAEGGVNKGQSWLPFSISSNAGLNIISLSQQSKSVTRDVGYILGAALGYSLTPNWQTTVSYDYISNTGSGKAQDKQNLILVNGYYNFRGLLRNVPQLVPYLGVGLGYIDLSETNGTYGIINGGGFAYRVALGTDYYFTPEFALGAAYKFTGASVGYGKIDSNIFNHSIIASFSYHFG